MKDFTFSQLEYIRPDFEKLKKELVCDGYSKTQLITMVEAQMRIINSLKSDFIFISEMQTLYEIYEQLI